MDEVSNKLLLSRKDPNHLSSVPAEQTRQKPCRVQPCNAGYVRSSGEKCLPYKDLTARCLFTGEAVPGRECGPIIQSIGRRPSSAVRRFLFGTLVGVLCCDHGRKEEDTESSTEYEQGWPCASWTSSKDGDLSPIERSPGLQSRRVSLLVTWAGIDHQAARRVFSTARSSKYHTIFSIGGPPWASPNAKSTSPFIFWPFDSESLMYATNAGQFSSNSARILARSSSV